jgi:ankyrin repeat protein/GNAT superfamily N-acetyltransferase
VIVMDGPPVDLARARREAKKLLRAARAGDRAARERIGTPTPQLSDAQLAIARELGARSWPALAREVGARDALIAAVAAGDAEALRAALAAGADPDEPGALHAAARAADPACVTLLLDAGATLHRSMALANAAGGDRVAMARVLLERGPQDWGERENALVWAVYGAASEEMFRLLVDGGADLEASFDGSGRTPYALAVRAGRPDLAELLASLGALRRLAPIDELVGACMAGDRAEAERLAAAHPDAVRLLRTAEADLLVEAAERGLRDTVELLLDLGVAVDARGLGGATALEVAKDDAVAALLVARGADPAKRAPAEEHRAGEPPYAELAWAAEAAYLRHLASSPLVESRPCGDGIAVITGIDDNTENGVVCSRLEGDVGEAVAWLRGVPAQWLVADDQLRDRLVAAGASPERTGVVMGAELDQVVDGPPPAGIEVVAVRDDAALAEWMAIAGESTLDAPPADLERRAAVVASLGLDARAPLQLRIARRVGRAIGVASFFVHGETVLGQHVGVVAEERRAGVGHALVRTAARDARAAGARVAVLGPTPDTIGFYRLLGAVLRPALRDRSFYLP